MINYKEWNLKTLGNMVIFGIVLFLLIALMHIVVSPVLTMVLPMVFTTGLTITEILLFLILVRLYAK